MFQHRIQPGPILRHLAILFALATLVALSPIGLAPTRAEDETTETENQPAAEPVKSIFPDKKLEAVVRKQVYSKRNNDEPLTAEDVEKVSTIVGKGQGVTDLTGLEHCVSLMQLDLEESQIKDLTPLKQLSELQQVILAGNQIEDLSPLAGLKKLQYLELSRNKIQDLRPLAELTKMQSLYLSGNQIEDLSPIAKMQKLWSLYVDGNKISDLKPIAGLRWLSSLDASDNQIEDLSPLTELTELRIVLLRNNQLTTLAPIVSMVEKDAEGDRSFATFLRLYVSGNPFSEAAQQEQVPRLRELCRLVETEQE